MTSNFLVQEGQHVMHIKQTTHQLLNYHNIINIPLRNIKGQIVFIIFVIII